MNLKVGLAGTAHDVAHKYESKIPRMDVHLHNFHGKCQGDLSSWEAVVGFRTFMTWSRLNL
jgi:hypothetical protein